MDTETKARLIAAILYAIAVLLACLTMSGCASAQAASGGRAALEAMAARAAEQHGVPVRLMKGICQVESTWRPHVSGDDGASIGVCQIQIDTGLMLYGAGWMRESPEAERRAAMRRILLNPWSNFYLTALLLRRYLDLFDGDETLAMMAYNGGPAHPLIDYVRKVRGAMARYE